MKKGILDKSMRKQERAVEVVKRLKKIYPDAHCELDHETPFQLLVATILSAQCTDVRVNMVTPHLFKKYPTAQKLAKAPLENVEEIIKSTGFYRSKAQNIVKCSQDLVSKFNGEVPQTIEELTSLAGVGRKTANVVLGNIFNINEGVVVDTHVKRITNLLKLTKFSDPIKIEKDLMKLFEKKDWCLISHLLIFLGRRVCNARKPMCSLWDLNDLCPSAKKS